MTNLMLSETQVRQIIEGVLARFGPKFSPPLQIAMKAAQQGKLYRVKGHALGGLRIGESPRVVLREALYLNLAARGLRLEGEPTQEVLDHMVSALGWKAELITVADYLPLHQQVQDQVCLPN